MVTEYAEYTSKDIKTVLRRAAELVANGWTPEKYAIDAVGNFVNPDSPDAVEFPMRRAITRAAKAYAADRPDTAWWQVEWGAQLAVYAEMKDMPGTKYPTIDAYNSAERRTAEQVIRLLKRAARNF